MAAFVRIPSRHQPCIMNQWIYRCIVRDDLMHIYRVFTYPLDRLKKTKNRFVEDKKVRVVIHTLGR